MCDCDYPEFFSETIRTARKAHKCGECFSPINLGEKYNYSSGKWDNFVGSYKTCLRCDTLRTWLGKKTDCCIAFGELRQELFNSNIIELVDPDGDDSPYQIIDYQDEIETDGKFFALKGLSS